MSSYDPGAQRRQELKEIFTFHPVQPGQPNRYEHMRAAAYELALDIVTLTPPSREQSTAITKLQEVVMWANAAIAIHEKPQPVEVPQ